MLTWAALRFLDKHELESPGFMFVTAMLCDIAIVYNISNIGWAFKCLK